MEIDICIGDERKLVTVSQPPGGGRGYDISYFDNPEEHRYWHLGVVLLTDEIWVFHLNANDIIDMVGMEMIATLLNGDQNNYSWR